MMMMMMRGRRRRRRSYNDQNKDMIVRAYSTFGKMGMQEGFGRKLEGKRPRGRLGQRWQVIKMGSNEIGCEGVNWLYLAQDVFKLCEHGTRPWSCRKGGQCLEHLSDCSWNSVQLITTVFNRHKYIM
jgi:hypothetical protein